MASPIQKRKQQRLIGFVILVVILVILGLVYRGYIWNTLSFVQSPLTRAASWVQDTAPAGLFGDERASEDAETFKQQRDQYAVDRGELERLRLENAHLKEQLGYIERSGYEHTSAAIIARDTSRQLKRFVIDRGGDDGVVVGAPIVVKDGVLAGTVVEVTSKTATVRAVNDPNARVAGSLLNETRTLGIVGGTTGNLMELSFVPQDKTINVDDLVTTSGLDTSIPAGLIIGRVNAVRDEEGAPFQTAIVEPMVDIRYYRIVSVLTSQP
jgi:rod shape-determining protein MreC